MTSRRNNRKLNNLPFWKRWFFWLLLLVLIVLTIAFTTLTLAIPFLYETDAQLGLLYGAGMSLILAAICGDSARRIYRKLRPKK